MDLTNFPSTAHIALTGPIGAGKTTLGKQLEQALRQAGHTVVISEEILSDAVVHLLELSNAEPQRYMELFQTVMLMRAAVRQTALGDQGIIIAERPLEESWVFGRANLALGRLSQEYFDQVYRPLHAEYKSPTKQLIVYATYYFTAALCGQRCPFSGTLQALHWGARRTRFGALSSTSAGGVRRAAGLVLNRGLFSTLYCDR